MQPGGGGQAGKWVAIAPSARARAPDIDSAGALERGVWPRYLTTES